MISQVTDPHMPSFIATPRVLWQSFVPVWLFPIFFFVGAQLAGRERFFPAWLFWVVALSLFFFGVGRPAFLFFTRRLSFVSLIVWGMVTPWLIWTSLVFVQYGFQHFGSSASAP